MPTLATKIAELPGVGPTYARRLAFLGVDTVRDLLTYLPRGHEDFSEVSKVIEAIAGETQTFIGHMRSLTTVRTRGGKTMQRGVFQDETGGIDVMWFNQPYIVSAIPQGTDLVVSGKVKANKFRKVFLSAPVWEPRKAEQLHTLRIVPIYPLTEGLTSKWLRTKISAFLPLLEKIPDPLPASVRDAHGLLDLPTALKEIHFPTSEAHLAKARRRLGFDELFLIQLTSLQQKILWKNDNAGTAPRFPLDEAAIRAFVATLPFTLTNAQKKAAFEILKDLEKPQPMLRLLEGDVGSGKTIVAALGLFAVVQQGAQGILMAPTEILARQHYAKLLPLFAKSGKNTQLLVGSTPGKARREILTGLATGTVDILVGTHAVLEDDVQLRTLGLAIIDEQHRFGVKQRALLRKRGTPHLLAMTATPIPRTMALTLYGDQDLSIIDELPPGRKTIVTRVIPQADRHKAYAFIESEIRKGRQVFVICPLIEDSPNLEVQSVTAEFEHLTDYFPQFKVALLHGRMKPKEKDAIMGAFARNEAQLLVSTSVIEVGIDVPNATIMMIEDADRFGLAQLHQFRGRVGRGETQSYCFLFSKLDADGAVTRLKAMEREASGFRLAELDLQLRGPGEVFGTRQSGIPDLRMASLLDRDLILETRQAAESVLADDATLEKHPLLKEEVGRSLARRGMAE